MFQIHQKLKKVVQILQPAIFVTKPSVVRAAAHIFGHPVLGQTKALEYNHVSQSTKRRMIREQ